MLMKTRFHQQDKLSNHQTMVSPGQGRLWGWWECGLRESEGESGDG